MVLATLTKPQELIPDGELQRLRAAEIFNKRFELNSSPCK
jgi:hypothetical protein